MMKKGRHIQTPFPVSGVPVRMSLSHVSLPNPALLQGAMGAVTSGM